MRHVHIPGVAPTGMTVTFAGPLLGWELCIEWTMHHCIILLTLSSPELSNASSFIEPD